MGACHRPLVWFDFGTVLCLENSKKRKMPVVQDLYAEHQIVPNSQSRRQKPSSKISTYCTQLHSEQLASQCFICIRRLRCDRAFARSLRCCCSKPLHYLPLRPRRALTCLGGRRTVKPGTDSLRRKKMFLGLDMCRFPEASYWSNPADWGPVQSIPFVSASCKGRVQLCHPPRLG